MYCRNCGRYIPEDGKDICIECLASKAVEGNDDSSPLQGDVFDTLERPSVKSRLACGIISAVAGQISFIVLYINMILSVGHSVYSYNIGGISILALIGWLLVATGCILGVVAIRRFSYARKNKYKKPIATLVTGIVGLIWSVLSLLLQIVLCVAIHV